jgi:hypothetical protein
MNRWMKRRIERSRARCERATARPQISTDGADKKSAAAAPMLAKDKTKPSPRYS